MIYRKILGALLKIREIKDARQTLSGRYLHRGHLLKISLGSNASLLGLIVFDHPQDGQVYVIGCG